MRFSQLPLTTERLLLRPLQNNDLDALYDLMSNPEFMRYWSFSPWTSRYQAEKSIADSLIALETGSSLKLGIMSKETGHLLGICSLFSIHTTSLRAELGYGLAPAHQGRGYMREALASLVNYGFSTLQLNRIEAEIDPRNTASSKVLEALGFQFEGRMRERWIVGGEVSDSAWYSLLAKHCPPQNPPNADSLFAKRKLKQSQ